MNRTVMQRWRCLTLIPVVLCGIGITSCQRFSRSVLPDFPLPETVVIPEHTAFSMTVRTDPEALMAGLSLETETWQSELETETGIDWAEDVEPWLGETVTFALVDPNLDPQAEDSVPGFLFVAETQDAKASTAALEQMRDQQIEETGAGFEERSAGQVQMMIESGAAVGEQMVLASLGQSYVAIANDLGVMEEVIATFEQKEAMALSQNPEYNSVLEDLWQPEAVGFVYLDAEQVATDPEWSAEFDLSPEDLEAMAGLKSLSLVSQWQPQGLLMRGQANIDPQSLWGQVAAETVPGQVLERLPGNALAVISGGAIAQSWQRNVDQVTEGSEAESRLEELRQIFTAGAQLDLDEDVIRWMDGEFALALVADPAGHPMFQGLGAMLVIQSSQKEQAMAALETLDATAEQNRLLVSSDSDEVIWRDPIFNQPLLNHSWIEDFLVVSTSESARSTFAGDGEEQLPEVEPFKSLYEVLPKPNYGYMLVNWQGVLSAVKASQPGVFDELDPDAREALEAFSGMGVTTYPLDEDSYRMDLFLTVSQSSQDSTAEQN